MIKKVLGYFSKSGGVLNAIATIVIATLGIVVSVQSNNTSRQALSDQRKVNAMDAASRSSEIKTNNDEDEKKQADKFASWISDSNKDFKLKNINTSKVDEITHSNGSGLPIYDAYYFLTDEKHTSLESLKGIDDYEIFYMKVVAPGEDTFNMCLKENDTRTNLSYIFKDVSGNYFFRSAKGKLYTKEDLKHDGIENYAGLIKYLGLKSNGEEVYDNTYHR